MEGVLMMSPKTVFYSVTTNDWYCTSFQNWTIIQIKVHKDV